MIELSLAEIATALGCPIPLGCNEIRVTGPVVTDARLCSPGSLFVARVGANLDGLNFVPQAVAGGAVAVLAQRSSDLLPTLVVPDIQQAFGVLARFILGKVPEVAVIGITGSSGKTSTKDLLAQVLTAFGPTVATELSYNGEVGVPLTVARVESTTKYLITEMGARGRGHIQYLTTIAPPNIGVILNVGSAHLGEFGSVSEIAQAKSELAQAVPKSGVVILNADDPSVAAMAATAVGRVVLVGQSAAAQIRAENLQLDAELRPSFTLVMNGQRHPVQLAVHGEHQVGNALAVIAVALELELELKKVLAALSQAGPTSPGRMQLVDRADGIRIINDAYNANPESMRAALKALAVAGTGRRTWAILGEMLELGAASIPAHDELGRLVVRLDISRLVVVGEGARAIHTGAVQEGSWGEESQWVPDLAAAREILATELAAGDVVLLKSSRNAGLITLAQELATPANSFGGLA